MVECCYHHVIVVGDCRVPSLRSSLLLFVTLAGLFMTACPGGGLFPKPKNSGSPASPASGAASAVPTAAPTAEAILSGSLKSDWTQASRAAGSWATDAQLYEIEGQTIDANGRRDTAKSAASWVYRFAAPSHQGQLLTVAITGKDQVISQVIAGTAPYPTFRLSAVGLDSPLAFSKASVTGTDVRVHVLNDQRYGVVVYLFPDKERLRLDAFTGEKLTL
jgi:hypothetical protein